MPVTLATQDYQGPRQKVHEILFQPKKRLEKVVYICHPNYMGSINRRMTDQVSPGIKAIPYSKNKSKKGEDLAPVVECLLSNSKVLS
jgi:hypothetical protein